MVQAPAPESYLVRRTTHVDDEVTGYKIDFDYVIFRDGLVVGWQRLPNETFLIRARGTSDSVQRLQQTLSRNRFGSEAGRCNYRDQPGQGTGLLSAVTWFGRRGDRSTTVRFGVTYPVSCSAGFEESIAAIARFFSEAGSRPDAQIERVPGDIFGSFAATPPPPSP